MQDLIKGCEPTLAALCFFEVFLMNTGQQTTHIPVKTKSAHKKTAQRRAVEETPKNWTILNKKRDRLQLPASKSAFLSR
jgi:hypothetical protein